MDGTTGVRWQASYAMRVPPHVKGQIHKMIVQPAMLYGMETVPVTSSHVKKLEVTEMKMSRWACGHTLKPGTHHAIFVFCWTQGRRKDDRRMVCAHQRRSSSVDFTNATVVGLLHGVCGSTTSVASTDRSQTNHSEAFTGRITDSI